MKSSRQEGQFVAPERPGPLTSADFYDAMASFYEASVPDGERVTKTKRVDKLHHLFASRGFPSPAQTRVLDLGCGDGAYALAFAMAGYDVTGMDASGKMLERCRMKAEQHSLTVRLIAGDWVEALHDDLGPFHIVICAGNSLHHNPPDYVRRLFRACRDVLVPGGILIVNGRDYGRELSELSDAPERADLAEVFEDIEVPGMGARRGLKVMVRNARLDKATGVVQLVFYTYSDFRRDRRTFNVHLVEMIDGGGRLSRMTTLSTDVYYLFREDVEKMLTEAGFSFVARDEKLDSAKSWYLTAARPV